MIQLLIIADDFTGALDTGVQLAEAGARTKVVVGNASTMDESYPDCDVLVIDAETRHLDAKEAYGVVYDIASKAVSLKVPHIFKKTDSALRGNIGAELSALLDASGDEKLPFAPAFPQIGRTTCGGVHLINNIAVADSVFGADPFEPVSRSKVDELIGLQSDVPVVLQKVPGIEDHLDSGRSIVVFDSSSTEDLEAVMALLKREGLCHIMAGCAGFGAALPSLLALGEEKDGKGDFENTEGLMGREFSKNKFPKLDPRLLVVCGSVNPITLTQLDNAQKSGFSRLRLTPRQKLEEGYWDSPGAQSDLGEIEKLLSQNPHCIIDSNDAEGSAPTKAYADEHNMTLDDIRLGISRSIGHIVKSIYKSPSLGTLLITGGDTLLQCMQYMGVNTLEPVCEMEAGIVLSRFSYEGREKFVITKSGGIGSAALMSRIAEMIAA